MARVIALATEAAAANKNQHKVVNIIAAMPNDPQHSIKTIIQHTAAQIAANPSLAPTYVAAPSVTKGLPTIFITGYTAPN